jgi:hypothetical protein
MILNQTFRAVTCTNVLLHALRTSLRPIAEAELCIDFRPMSGVLILAAAAALDFVVVTHT